MEPKSKAPRTMRMTVPVTIREEEEYQSLLEQMEKQLSIKSSLTKEVNPPNKVMKGVITRIAYAAFALKLEGTNKIIYIVRFPPTDGTVVPLLDEPSSEYDLQTDEHISLAEATAFWSCPDARQINGLWKGGSWGLDNLLPHSIWCSDAWIGDTVTLEFVKNGIIKFGFGIPGFPNDNENELTILPNTMNSAWSLNITVDKTGKKYAGYGMNFFMPQYANDLLFIWKNPQTGKRLVKICKRGDAPTVDMQNKLMPGAGEHLEPGEQFKFKASLHRAFREELGVADVALAQCYVIDLGKFDDPGRDPRYWTFFSEYGQFGMKRYSATHGFVLYFVGDAPLLTLPADQLEVTELGPSEKRWVDLESLDVSSDAWMIEDHVKIVRRAKESVRCFDMIPDDEKAKYLYNIDQNNQNMVCYKQDEWFEGKDLGSKDGL